jgi:hypothetical protein
LGSVLDGVVMTLRAVVEVPLFDADGSWPWPMEPMPAWSWLALHGGCTDEQVGLFVALLANSIGGSPSSSLSRAIAGLLAQELLVIDGGLQLSDTESGVSVDPGCCAGLEDWRDWTEVLAGGGSPWLGHSPDPEIEVVGDLLRVWQDRGHDGVHLDLPKASLPALMKDVHADLVGFLAAVADWTERLGSGIRGGALVQEIARLLVITESGSV